MGKRYVWQERISHIIQVWCHLVYFHPAIEQFVLNVIHRYSYIHIIIHSNGKWRTHLFYELMTVYCIQCTTSQTPCNCVSTFYILFRFNQATKIEISLGYNSNKWCITIECQTQFDRYEVLIVDLFNYRFSFNYLAIYFWVR